MAAQEFAEKKGLREGAVRWLNGKFEAAGAKSFDQRYEEAQKLIKIAYISRATLERRLPFISPERADVRKTYSQYSSAVSALINDLEDAISRMEKLRGEFSKSENSDQLPAYDAQLSNMKERLAEFKKDLKWRPGELRGFRPEEIKDVMDTQVASLDVRTKKVPTRVQKGDTMEFTATEIEEYARAHPPSAPRQKKTEEMVFTLAETEAYYKKHHMEIPAQKQRKKGEEMVFSQEEIALRDKAEALDAKIRKERNKPKEERDFKKLYNLRTQRLAIYEELSKLSGEPVPERVKLKRA